MKQCPLQDEYRFKTQCRIATCKMYNEKTPCRCLAMDTSFAANDKSMSDAELVFFKFPNHSQREVASIRKRAVSRVQAVLALNQVVRHVQNHERPEHGLNSHMMRQLPSEAKQLLKKSFRSKLFRIRHLDIQVWMLPFVLDFEYANRIVPDFNRFAIHLLFRWTPKELETVVDAFTKTRTSHRGQG